MSHETIGPAAMNEHNFAPFVTDKVFMRFANLALNVTYKPFIALRVT